MVINVAIGTTCFLAGEDISTSVQHIQGRKKIAGRRGADVSGRTHMAPRRRSENLCRLVHNRGCFLITAVEQVLVSDHRPDSDGPVLYRYP